MRPMTPSSRFLSGCDETRRGPGQEPPAGVAFELAQGRTLGLRAKMPRFTSFAAPSISANSNVTPAGAELPRLFILFHPPGIPNVPWA